MQDPLDIQPIITLYHYTIGCDFASCTLCSYFTRFCEIQGLLDAHLEIKRTPAEIRSYKMYLVEHRMVYPVFFSSPNLEDFSEQSVKTCIDRTRMDRLLIENLNRNIDQRIICMFQCPHSTEIKMHRIDLAINKGTFLYLSECYFSMLKGSNDRKRSRDENDELDPKGELPSMNKPSRKRFH